MLVRIVTDRYVAGIEIDQEGRTIKCAPILKYLKEINMIIKFDSIKDHTWTTKKGKEFTGKLVKGTRIDNDKEWSKEIFSNQEDIINAFSEFGKGEVINVRFIQEKGFWNIDRTNLPSVASEDMIAKAKEGFVKSNPTSPVGQTGGGGASQTYLNNYSPSKKWGGRTGEAYDRSAAIYLAFDMIKSVNTDANMRKASADEILDNTLALASKINDYIHSGKKPTTGSGEDLLDPPV
jgi:hypothetical protein